MDEQKKFSRLDELSFMEFGQGFGSASIVGFLKHGFDLYQKKFFTSEIPLKEQYLIIPTNGFSEFHAHFVPSTIIHNSVDITQIEIRGEIADIEALINYLNGDFLSQYNDLPLKDVPAPQRDFILYALNSSKKQSKLSTVVIDHPAKGRVLQQFSSQRKNKDTTYPRNTAGTEQKKVRQLLDHNTVFMIKSADMTVFESYYHDSGDPLRSLLYEKAIINRGQNSTYKFIFSLTTKDYSPLPSDEFSRLKEIVNLTASAYDQKSYTRAGLYDTSRMTI